MPIHQVLHFPGDALSRAAKRRRSDVMQQAAQDGRNHPEESAFARLGLETKRRRGASTAVTTTTV